MADKSRGGRILDIVEPARDRLELAWVREEAKGKARLRTAGGREHSLSSKALDEASAVDHGPAGDDPLAALARRTAEIDAQRRTIAPDELDLLWESVAADEDDRRTLEELARELLGPQAGPVRSSALGRALEADGERFVLSAKGARFTVLGRKTRETRARKAQEDARRREEDAKRRAEEAEHAATIVARLHALLEPADPPAPWPADLDPFLDGLLEASRLDRKLDDAPTDAAATRVARTVAAQLEGADESWTVRALAERLLRVRHPGSSRTLRTRRLLGLGTDFTPDVEAEAHAAAGAAVAGIERLDLTALPCLAVDDPWTRLRDDALAVVETDGALEVYVHISDAASAVARGSALDRAAMRRGTAHYWPDGIIPMLPRSLAETHLSLDADGAPRNAFTAHFRCSSDDAGPILELLRLGPSRVLVAANRTYEEVDAALAAPSTPDDALLAKLWEHLAAVRRRRLPLDEPERREVRLVVEADGARIELREIAAGTPARRIVEELALATGMAVARWARERDVPLIHRVQDAPHGGRGPSRATYTLTPDEHHAMGGALYAHVTSPLRRYVDLLNQRQVFARLSGGKVEADPQVDLQRMTLGVRDVLDRARDLERDAHRYWALRWLAREPDAVRDAELRLEPQALDGSRPPRVLVLPVSVLLPVDGAEALLDHARRDPPPAAGSFGRPAVVPVRVRVEVRDAEALSAKTVVVP
jgi:exoribonuclease-2